MLAIQIIGWVGLFVLWTWAWLVITSHINFDKEDRND